MVDTTVSINTLKATSIMAMNKISSMFIILLIIIQMMVNVKCSLSDVTSEVFGSRPPTGVIVAFGDLNADKATDIFVLSENGRSLFILEAEIDIRQVGTKFTNKTFIQGKPQDAIIVNVVPGDFNSDSQMDVLVMRKAGQEESSSQVTVDIYLGNGMTGTKFFTVNETFRDQPIVIDGNGDMAPDLFGETVDGERALWSFQNNRTYISYYHDGTNLENLAQLKIPQSSAFIDLDGDLIADLCAVTGSHDNVSFEFWLNLGGNLTYQHSVSAPKELKVVGQASFVDLNGNHEMNIVLPGCLDENCKDSAIFVWSNRKETSEGIWHQLDVNFNKDPDHMYTFPKTVKPVSWISLPIALRMGDFNLDGYPDAVAVLSDSKGSFSSFLLYNEPCGTGCQNFSRTLTIDSHALHKYKPALATFFDLMEDGVLDILLTEDNAGTAQITAVQQDFTGDASFLKVLVVSGLCQKSCPNGHLPYGVNQVGPTARFESTTPTGSDQIGVATQLSQSSYLSLQLPFMLFGLGQTPNFVDVLTVGIPSPFGKPPRSHSWSSIIPNSQIIVIPHPVEDPESWKHELYVTPSRLVLLTGVSLLGTCTFIAVIVGLLHWKERMEDKKEKLQEAQRFHFDAM